MTSSILHRYMRELSHVFFSCELGTHAPFSRTSFVPARIRDDFSSDRVGYVRLLVTILWITLADAKNPFLGRQ